NIQQIKLKNHFGTRGVVVERTKGKSGREIAEMDYIVGVAGSDDGTILIREMGRVREERG
ncbi:hypothetical protein A2U01_0034435, partial [Trifolium medium]|nr:hypothetical protein [Trifolium medium]